MVGKYILFGFLILHGTVHFFGLAKIFECSMVSSPNKNYWYGYGLYCGCFVHLIFFAAFMVFKQDLNWWFFALAGMVLSIYLTSRFGSRSQGWTYCQFCLDFSSNHWYWVLADKKKMKMM